MVNILIKIIQLISQLISLLILSYVIMSFLITSQSKFRNIVSRIIDPMLAPIRKVVRPFGGVDFSPVILIILIQLISSIAIGLLAAISL